MLKHIVWCVPFVIRPHCRIKSAIQVLKRRRMLLTSQCRFDLDAINQATVQSSNRFFDWAVSPVSSTGHSLELYSERYLALATLHPCQLQHSTWPRKDFLFGRQFQRSQWDVWTRMSILGVPHPAQWQCHWPGYPVSQHPKILLGSFTAHENYSSRRAYCRGCTNWSHSQAFQGPFALAIQHTCGSIYIGNLSRTLQSEIFPHLRDNVLLNIDTPAIWRESESDYILLSETNTTWIIQFAENRPFWEVSNLAER